MIGHDAFTLHDTLLTAVFEKILNEFTVLHLTLETEILNAIIYKQRHKLG